MKFNTFGKCFTKNFIFQTVFLPARTFSKTYTIKQFNCLFLYIYVLVYCFIFIIESIFNWQVFENALTGESIVRNIKFFVKRLPCVLSFINLLIQYNEKNNG